MGGKKKKSFIDKKRSATFTLVARDSASSSSNPLSSDRVFVRTDNNNDYSVPGFLDSDEEQYNRDEESSVFADAVEEGGPARFAGRSNGSGLSEEVRKEILELGLPDDGYNYLTHLREIRNEGGGSAYYENPRARFDLVPLDVKAYDASKVRVSSDSVKDEEPGVDTIYKVASKSAPVRVQKAIDPDVTRLLDDSDLSRFGSDVEDLEEDFVLMANQPDGEEDENEDVQVKKSGADEDVVCEREIDSEVDDELDDVVQQRVRRPLDDAFDEAFKEYLSSDEDDGPIFGDENQEELEEKLKDALKEFDLEGSVQEEVYRAPADSVKEDQESAQVIRKCTEYAQKYLNESEGEEREVVLVSESSDESEMWDCETIVSTYSNLDNHPAKIEAPGKPKRRLQPKSIPFPGEFGAGKDVITLGGKEMLPVNYLPQRKRIMEGLVREKLGSAEKPKKVVGEESKEEKKERKAALKNERREARKSKKELKGLYKSETQRAQKAVAVTGPSSIHLM